MASEGWVRAEAGLELRPDEVQVWRARVTPEGVESGWRVLNEGERARAERYVVARAREEFVAGRGMLRRLLGGALGCPAEDVRLEEGAFGKPRVEGVEFNVSHSGGMVLVALGLGAVGVDVERVDVGVEALEIARGAFAAGEVARIGAAEGMERVRRFYEIWVRKEAVVKVDGVGIGAGLDGFKVDGDGWVEVGGRAYWVEGIAVGEGYRAAVASCGRPRVRRWELGEASAVGRPEGSGSL